MTRTRQVAMPLWLGVLIVLLGGCATDKDKDLPASAQLMAQGNRGVTAVAPEDGMIYINNDTTGKRVYAGQVHKGDSITVDREKKGVMINDRLVSEQQISTTNDYKIYFMPMTHSSDGTHNHDMMR